MLARQATAAVGVGTCRPCETAATLPSARRCKALRRPRGGEGRGISWRPPAYSLSYMRLLQESVLAPPVVSTLFMIMTNVNDRCVLLFLEICYNTIEISLH